MSLRKVRGNVASCELALGIFAFLKLAEALRGRPEEGLCSGWCRMSGGGRQ